QKNVPFPLFSAYLSAYAQMICGISILLGAFVRPFAVLFIINFIAAVIIAHIGDSFRAMFPALMMIAAGFFFLFNGAGKLSVDEILERKGKSFGNEPLDAGQY
ncbi:MAG: DoxX family protein, partial [Acidobacteriota bacterium]|nr:DoxX family protein [Acidobacteriota bacterium]